MDNAVSLLGDATYNFVGFLMRMLVLELRCYPFSMHYFIKILSRIYEKNACFWKFQCVQFVALLHDAFVIEIEIGFSALCVSDLIKSGMREVLWLMEKGMRQM